MVFEKEYFPKELHELVTKAMSGDKESLRILKDQFKISPNEKKFYYIPKEIFKKMDDNAKKKFYEEIDRELNITMPETENNLDRIENTVRQLIIALGTVEAAKILDMDYTNISAWLKGNRKWTYNKILAVANLLKSVPRSELKNIQSDKK